MKKVKILGIMIAFIIMSTGLAFSAEKAPQKIIDLAHSKLSDLGADPIIVKAVKEENEKRKSLAQIQEMDNKWKAHAGIADYMQAMMDSECGKHLRDIQSSAGYYAEIFVMDNQGANVAMTDKTSDYWQGDEAKFKKTYNGGLGAVFIDDVEFDDSAQAYLVQVSVPVRDGEKTIGAITIGIDVDKVEK
ncbi:MAG: cache domain-containing protein [Deltaproteobacteria bacterium]|nr:cache domain-containing protein [Deltaproteobacteria bacterium]